MVLSLLRKILDPLLYTLSGSKFLSLANEMAPRILFATCSLRLRRMTIVFTTVLTSSNAPNWCSYQVHLINCLRCFGNLSGRFQTPLSGAARLFSDQVQVEIVRPEPVSAYTGSLSFSLADSYCFRTSKFLVTFTPAILGFLNSRLTQQDARGLWRTLAAVLEEEVCWKNVFSSPIVVCDAVNLTTNFSQLQRNVVRVVLFEIVDKDRNFNLSWIQLKTNVISVLL